MNDLTCYVFYKMNSIVIFVFEYVFHCFGPPSALSRYIFQGLETFTLRLRDNIKVVQRENWGSTKGT